MNTIVSIEWLNQHLKDPDLILLDASLQTTAEGASADSQLQTIPGARYFDLKNSFSDCNSPFPNTLPTEKQFEANCQKLGIHKNSKIIVFDSLGIYSSPRVWWLLKVMGHQDVSVLNGGFPEWERKGYTTELRTQKYYELGTFKATLETKSIKNYQDILNNLHEKTFTIVDARSKGRFNGTENEPRKYLKSGHIPDAINMPYQDLLENGKFKSELELKKIINQKLPKNEKLVFSCGSGLTACIVMLACETVSQKGIAIYDGSWTEWAELQDLKTI